MKKTTTLLFAFLTIGVVAAQDTLAIKNQGEFKGSDKNIKTEINNNGYEYVDLGLSVKWATCNVGANNPWDYGDYFAWGETVGFNKKDKSNMHNFTTNNSYLKTKYDWGSYKYCQDSNGEMVTKYTNNNNSTTSNESVIL